MFGVGFQEILLIGVLFLIVFGPAKAGQMFRDLGKFVYGARSSIEEFKAELTAADHPNRGKEEGGRRRQGQKPAEKEQPQRTEKG
jgi:Sec-independent protein translocase protein TatA